MSIVPLMFRDWWDDFGIDHPSSRLLDQHFGMGLNRNDLLSSFRNSPSLFRGGYFRPWRSELLRQDSGSTVTADKDKFQVNWYHRNLIRHINASYCITSSTVFSKWEMLWKAVLISIQLFLDPLKILT